eukprot:Protomagalhaensia_wolfi_Nauph_80__6244@NODE_947_length_1859_cov_23_302747_g715_i0_p1_GENE_NODE_947_length_1859_cov_23_302747_g715_i0NODE_947_length_1859_cov_23_302747_g715_i0_p1_ORF_typecomplete_len518_score135_64tRNAsynt_1g/PF09334_11/1_2e123tRNAsynt_1/PF00133_22/2_4e22tRNAsynt_1/PF00133_22/8_3e22tRNAsynt_1e/PF01406_19/1e09tRNAsynt_1e/PF01406_19/6_2e07Anticodon_1/PF08264_13/9_8e11tRNAsynt_1f/PF01921_18/0_012tRNAsynt_1f/PF01921_18/0_00031tRNAsynt_1d/PF00750_19/0_00066tRNAsynt_1d/PF00750_19/9_2tR
MSDPKPLTYEERNSIQQQKFYLTTAINYLNGPPHVGHAYEILTADVIARYHRVAGRDVWFVTGSDEHGQKIATTAEKAGKEPSQFCNEMVEKFKSLNRRLECSEDFYVRTHTAEHMEFCQWLWKRVEDRGDIYLGNYEGWYSVREEMFVADKDAELNGFKDPETGLNLEKRNEESYFFRMSKYHDRVYDLLKNTDYLQPETRRNELLHRLERNPLEDLSISRTQFSWGVPVPSNKAHVMYVWFDALSNYMSAVQFHKPESTLSKFWPADCHLIGKDITWFHCVIWPAMLMAAELPLPQHVFGHGFINAADGAKMSKSLGNVVNPIDCLDHCSPDTFRYYLCKEARYGADVRYSNASLVDMHNSDLVSVLGNLVHRCVALAVKSCEGKVPEVECVDCVVDIGACFEKAEKAMEGFELHELLQVGLDVAKAANKYLTDEAPWKIKDDPAKKAKVIRSTMEAVYLAAHYLQPIIPKASEEIFRRLNCPQKKLFQLNANGMNLQTGVQIIAEGEVLFKRLE